LERRLDFIPPVLWHWFELLWTGWTEAPAGAQRKLMVDEAVALLVHLQDRLIDAFQ
jgi:hypothetical protein